MSDLRQRRTGFNHPLGRMEAIFSTLFTVTLSGMKKPFWDRQEKFSQQDKINEQKPASKKRLRNTLVFSTKTAIVIEKVM